MLLHRTEAGIRVSNSFWRRMLINREFPTVLRCNMCNCNIVLNWGNENWKHFRYWYRDYIDLAALCCEKWYGGRYRGSFTNKNGYLLRSDIRLCDWGSISPRQIVSFSCERRQEKHPYPQLFISLYNFNIWRPSQRWRRILRRPAAILPAIHVMLLPGTLSIFNEFSIVSYGVD